VLGEEIGAGERAAGARLPFIAVDKEVRGQGPNHCRWNINATVTNGEGKWR
jgi:hypothetical protein